jgi:hypothetical protein
VEYALGSGMKLDADRAICAGSEAAGAVVCLLEWAGHVNAVDLQDASVFGRSAHRILAPPDRRPRRSQRQHA